MKVSLWQQFSSNNSTSFTVVGKFPSVDEARHARDVVVQLLTAIGEWYLLPENDALRKKMYLPDGLMGAPLTAVESEYSQKYGIDWGQPINWVNNTEGVQDAVQIFDMLVIVENGYPLKDSFMKAHPIDALLERLGAETYTDQAGTDLLVLVTAVAPDVATLNDVMQMTEPEQGIQAVKLKHHQLTLWFKSIEYHAGEILLHGVELRRLAHVIEFLKERNFSHFRYTFEQAHEDET
jgi:hypothetical protein